MPYVDITGFLSETITVTAWAASQQDHDAFTGSQHFMPVTEEGARVARAETAAEVNGVTITPLPVGAVYSALDGFIITKGSGAAAAALGGAGENRLSLTEGNEVYIPVCYHAVRYNHAWTASESGTYSSCGRNGEWSDASENSVLFYRNTGDRSGVFAFDSSPTNFVIFQSFYAMGLTDMGGGLNRITLPVDDAVFTDAALACDEDTLADGEGNPVAFAKPIAKTGMPQWYLFVADGGLFTHHNPGLAFDDGAYSLPAGALVLHPNTDIIFRQGDSPVPITVRVDGTVMLWPGCSFDIDQDGLPPVTVTRPGYYDIPTRTFHPLSQQQVTVTFDADGGDMDSPSADYWAQMPYGLLPAPTLADHYFLGWYNDSGYVRTAIDTVPDASHTLTAGWVPLEHVVYVFNDEEYDSVWDVMRPGTRVVNGDGGVDAFFPKTEEDFWESTLNDTLAAITAIEHALGQAEVDEAVIVFGCEWGAPEAQIYRARPSSLVFTREAVTHLRGIVNVDGYSDDPAPPASLMIGGSAVIRSTAAILGPPLTIGDSATVIIDSGEVFLNANTIFEQDIFSCGIVIQGNAQMIVNGGMVSPGALGGFGVTVLDGASLTVNGGVFAPLTIYGAFLAAGDASVQINGGQLYLDATAMQWAVENSLHMLGLDMNANDMEWLLWLIEQYLSHVPVAGFTALSGSPVFEVNGGAFHGNWFAYASPQALVDALMSFQFLRVEVDPAILYDLEMNPPTPTVALNGGTFASSVCNLLVTRPEGEVILGGAALSANCANILLTPGAKVTVDGATFQRGNRRTLSVFEETAAYEEGEITLGQLIGYLGDVAYDSAQDSTLGGLWPTDLHAEIMNAAQAIFTAPFDDQLVIVQGGAAYQADFIPYGYPGYRFKQSNDGAGPDLVYDIEPWAFAVTITEPYQPGGAPLVLPAFYGEPLPPFAANAYAQQSIFIGARDTVGVWYYDNHGDGIRDWDKDDDDVLNGIWDANSYRVVYFANGGRFDASDSSASHMMLSVVNVEGDFYPVPAVPTREGYAFDGWNTQEDGTGASVTPGATPYSPGASARMVFAQWEACHTPHPVTLRHGIGSALADTIEALCGFPMPGTDQSGIALAPPAGAGAFIGYFDLASPGLKRYYDEDLLSARNWDQHDDNAELTALFAPPDTVAFHANGGEYEYVTPYDAVASHLQTVPTLEPTGLDPSRRYGFPEPPALAGHALAGWNTKADGTGTAVAHGAPAPATASILFARWTLIPDNPTVTLIPEHGVPYIDNAAAATREVQATPGAPMPAIVPPYSSATVSGATGAYLFAGYTNALGAWYYDGNGDSLRNWDNPEGDTLYAAWAEDTDPGTSPTVVFYGTGGTPAVQFEQAANGAYALPPQTPARPGYTFLGWNTRKDGSGTAVAAGTPYAGQRFAYAQWRDGEWAWVHIDDIRKHAAATELLWDSTPVETRLGPNYSYLIHYSDSLLLPFGLWGQIPETTLGANLLRGDPIHRALIDDALLAPAGAMFFRLEARKE
ncbi:MAG: InlB B-repeat-containing protein [Kiritimatiellaeota bacterium]|nr:InlB B-repeat-containing protein [Kiritimatiellota bacterium]